MKSYLGMFKMSFKGELQYRAKAFSGVLTQFFWGIMYVYLYTSFMGGDIIDGFSIAQMASYVWLGQAFFALRYIDVPPNSAKEIANGDVCYKFTRPINLYNQWFAENLGHKLSSALLRSPLIIIVALILPSSCGLMLPVSFGALILAFASLMLGTLIMCSIAMIAVSLIFKTTSAKGVVNIIHTITGLLGGLFIPLPLMPTPVQNVLNYLPFRFITDLPLRIYIGNVGIMSALMFMGIALLWLIALVALGKMLLSKACKNAIIQGG